MSKDMYNDYDILNGILIDKYKVVLPEKVKDSVFFKEGELVILSMEIIAKLVDDISDMDLDEIAKEVNENPVKWTTMRELKRF